MTVRMLQAFNGKYAGQIVSTLSGPEETRLIGLNLASADLGLRSTASANVSTDAGVTVALVDGAGKSVLRIDGGSSGADVITPLVQHLQSTDAMSTTVTVRLTPTGTFRKARISWVNNGASGSAKLNIAANCGNDVEGLVASQSALQRDCQMTMGGAISLVSPTPITSLNFSSDVSIASDAHRLLVTFGA